MRIELQLFFTKQKRELHAGLLYTQIRFKLDEQTYTPGLHPVIFENNNLSDVSTSATSFIAHDASGHCEVQSGSCSVKIEYDPGSGVSGSCSVTGSGSCQVDPPPSGGGGQSTLAKLVETIIGVVAECARRPGSCGTSGGPY